MRRCSALHVALLVTLGLVFSLTPLALAQRAQPPSQAPKAQPFPSDRLVELEERVRELQSTINGLAGEFPYRFALLDCNSTKYVEFRLLESNLVFFAACEKIEPPPSSAIRSRC